MIEKAKNEFGKRGRIATITLVLGSACLLLYGCVPKASSVVGTYAPNDDNDPATLSIRTDGTFVEMERGMTTGEGTWRLASDYYFFRSLELEGRFRLTAIQDGEISTCGLALSAWFTKAGSCA